jgi:hypothetical protein
MSKDPQKEIQHKAIPWRYAIATTSVIFFSGFLMSDKINEIGAFILKEYERPAKPPVESEAGLFEKMMLSPLGINTGTSLKKLDNDTTEITTSCWMGEVVRIAPTPLERLPYKLRLPKPPTEEEECDAWLDLQRRLPY